MPFKILALVTKAQIQAAITRGIPIKNGERIAPTAKRINCQTPVFIFPARSVPSPGISMLITRTPMANPSLP